MFRRSRGFATGVLVALITLFGAILGVSLVVISTTQQVGAGLDLQGVRAYYAARAGLEWGLYHVLRTGYAGCAGAGGIDGRSIDFTGNLAGFRATLACTETSHDEGGATVATYSLTATACNAATCPAANPVGAYVERQLRATAAK